MFNSAKCVPIIGSGNQKDESDQQDNKNVCDKGDRDADDLHTARAFELIKIDSDTEDTIEDSVIIMNSSSDFIVKDAFHDSSEEEKVEVQEKTKSPGEVGVTAVLLLV